MLSSAAKGTPWCLADVRGTEMFAIAAKVRPPWPPASTRPRAQTHRPLRRAHCTQVVPYYNGVCTCRVGVMVVYKPAKEE